MVALKRALTYLAALAALVAVRAADAQVIVPFGSQWRYEASGSSLDAVNWQDVGFNDSGWSIGAAPLGYGGTVTTNVRGGNPVYSTYYFRHSFVPGSAVDSLRVSVERDDGCVVYLNGTEIARSNMGEGVISFADFSHGVANGFGQTEVIDITIDHTLLDVGVQNVLAVEVHQHTTDSTEDLEFDLRLETLPPLDPVVTLLSPRRESAAQIGAPVTFDAKAIGFVPLASATLRIGDAGSPLADVATQPIAGGPLTAMVTFAGIAVANAGNVDWNVAFTDVDGNVGVALEDFALDRNAGVPDAPASLSPPPGQQGVFTDVTLSASIDDPDGDVVTVEFFVRPALGEAEEFTFAVIPDTQKYVDFTDPFTEGFRAQTDWIRANRDAWNIKYVLHEGDIVENESVAAFNGTGGPVDPRLIGEWQLASAYMGTLDLSAPLIPFGILPGNHDIKGRNPPATAGDFTRYDAFFPPGRMTWGFDSFPVGSNRNNVQRLVAGGENFLFVNLEYCPDMGNADQIIAWAFNHIATNQDHRVVITTHAYLDGGGNRNIGGCGSTQYIFDNLVAPFPNVDFVLCGHVSDEEDNTFMLPVDNDFVVFVGPNDTDDIQINAGGASSSPGAAVLRVDGSPHQHTLIKFPTLFGANGIPAGQPINSAILTLRISDTGNTMRAYQLAAGSVWNEATVLFNGTFPEDGADGPLSTTGAFINVPSGSIGTVQIDITSMVASWAATNPNGNNGLVLVDTGNSGVGVDSSESANPPTLRVDFGAPAGQRPFHELLADYQNRARGGDGWLRLMRFVPAEQRVYVHTFSPTRHDFETDAGSQFSLPLDLTGGFSVSDPIPANTSAGPVQVSADFVDLPPNTEFEWFVKVTDPAGNVVSSDVSSFTNIAGDTLLVDVNRQGGGPQDGLTWDSAFESLEDAIAQPGWTEIWVADGVYVPSSQSSSFVIPNGKQVYGGFAGTETTREERDPEANPTILSGDIGGNDTVGTDAYGFFDLLNRSDNAYHVVEAIGVGGSTTLDGFIVTGGSATGAGIDNSGGGIYVSGTLAVTNCFVTGNRAVKGGGVFTTGGSTTLTNCVVVRNRTTSDRGGGIHSSADGIQIRNSTVAHNIAMYEGGGIATLTPMTQINIYNSVFWGNVHIYGYSTEEAQIWPAPGMNFPAYTCVQGLSMFAGYPGTIGSNPLFLDVDGPDGLAGTLDDDFRLSSGSPCLDVGSNGLTSVTTDVFLHPRVSGGAVDMGAFELEALPVLFVKTVPSGSGDGSSWANASTLQNALAQQDDVEIWVTTGTYKPGAARADSFVISGGKRVYGGFAGVETARSQRNPAANLTVLSGDLNGDDTLGPDTNWDSLLELANITDNSQHVVIAQGTDANALLDGFTVQSGYADPGAANTSGGGLLLLGPLTVSHCVIRNNHAVKGGGAAALGVPATFTDCLVTFNKTDNLVTGGGDRGGGIFSDDDLTLINCTVVYNTAKYEGGGVASIIPSGAQKLLTVTNCVFWGSTHIYGFSVEDAQCLVTAGKHAVTETCIQGLNLLANPTNIGSNPLFVNAAGNDFTIGTTDDNYRLQVSSPCRNNGSNAAVVSTLDLDNTARIKSTIVDMGAYES